MVTSIAWIEIQEMLGIAGSRRHILNWIEINNVSRESEDLTFFSSRRYAAFLRVKYYLAV